MSSRFSPFGVEIREPQMNSGKHELDEVCAFGAALTRMRGQDCGFHLERMDYNHVWLKIGDVAVNLYVEKRSLKMRAEIEPEEILTRPQILRRRKRQKRNLALANKTTTPHPPEKMIMKNSG